MTAANTLSDEDVVGEVSYTWSNGDTGMTTTLGQSDVGNAITVTASYTDGQGTGESVTSKATGGVVNVNDAPSGSVTTSGTAVEDQVLTAANTLSDEDVVGEVSYTWSNGDTGMTTTLGQTDVGNAITVTASYTDGQGTGESVTSEATGGVVNVNDAPSGSVTISGTVVEDQILTAANTLSDEDVVGEVSYTWSNGDTGMTTTLGQTDVGNVITVTASYTDGQGTGESVTSEVTGGVVNVNDAPSGSVTISGTAVEDQILTAANTLSDEDVVGEVSYTWSNGDTGTTTTLGQTDVGNAITVTASYTDGQGTRESVTSEATGGVVNVNDVPIGSVTISGAAVEDQILTAANTLSDEDVVGEVSYTWSNGDTGTTTTLGQSDVGNAITVTASYTDGQGTEESVTSEVTGGVVNVNDAPIGSVTISGAAVEDQILTAANTLSDEDVVGEVSYTWSNGDTGTTTTLGQSDVGNAITVTASYTDGQGTRESVTSEATGGVVNVNDAPSGSVTISGTAVEDQILTAANTLSDGDVVGEVSYTWSNGDTGTTTTLGQSDVGNAITVTASYTDGQGTGESVTSEATGGVVNVNDAPSGSVTTSGTAVEDQVLTAANTLSDEDVVGEVSYTWSNGDTGTTTTLGQSDVGNAITVTASYTDGQGIERERDQRGDGRRGECERCAERERDNQRDGG